MKKAEEEVKREGLGEGKQKAGEESELETSKVTQRVWAVQPQTGSQKGRVS